MVLEFCSSRAAPRCETLQQKRDNLSFVICTLNAIIEKHFCNPLYTKNWASTEYIPRAPQLLSQKSVSSQKGQESGVQRKQRENKNHIQSYSLSKFH